MEVLPVVTIKTAQGPVEINASDFKPGVHELHETSNPLPAPPAPPAAPAAPVVEQSQPQGTETPPAPPPAPVATVPPAGDAPPAATTPGAPPPPPAAPPAPAASDRLVMLDAGKWFVVDAAGNKLSKQGFADEASARAAVL